MIKKTIILIWVTFLVQGAVYAQETEKKYEVEKKISKKQHNFSLQLNAGLLEGEQGHALQLQAIYGRQNTKWFTGLGTGIDYYLFRSIPVYLSVNRFLKPGDHRFFILGEAGINFPWVSQALGRSNNMISDEFQPGLYWNAGLGFTTSLGKKRNNLVASVGYSYKHLKEITTQQVFCISPPCPPAEEIYNYHLRRLSIKLGWQFMAQ